jgi:hypothetical protein
VRISLLAIGVSFAFLILNVLLLLAVLAMNRRTGTGSGSDPTPRREKKDPAWDRLDPNIVLSCEFEYARISASESMEQRHTMVNFYLLAAGVMASGAVVVLAQGQSIPDTLATLLLWALCSVGWLHFLSIIRLRQAWHDSARAMNCIKEFYIQHVQDLKGEVLRDAFRWQAHTLPRPDKPWTVFFYSAMVVGLLNSAAYVLGGVLLGMPHAKFVPPLLLGILLVFGVVFFAFHAWLYFAFLKPPPSAEPGDGVSGGDG